MNARLHVGFNKITVEVDDPLVWDVMKTITGKVNEIHPGRYEIQLSVQNLRRLRERFGDDARVISGQHFVDKLLSKFKAYKEVKARLAEIKALERFPLEPNGKLIPRAHQTIIGGAAGFDPFLPICADCGTGKTPITAYSCETEIRSGRIRKGKILISSPLSLLDTAWVDDIRRFTSLNPGILWTKTTNKTVLHDEVIGLRDHGPRPAAALTSRKKKSMQFVNKRSREVVRKLLAIDNPDDYEKMMVTSQEATLLDGSKVLWGPQIAQRAWKEPTRLDAIKATLNDPQYDVFVINHDGVRIYEDLLKAHDFEWVVIDESTKIKSPSSQLFLSHCKISWNCKRRNILTGTPNPNGFQDVWAQYYFVDRGLTLEPCYKDFLCEWFEAVHVKDAPAGAMKYVFKDAAAKQRLIDKLRASGIFLRQRDCIDLPPRTDVTRVVYMNAAQQEAYEDMEDTLIAELVDDSTGKRIRAEAVNSLVKLMKLRQITSGFLVDSGKDKSGDKMMLSDHPKLRDLDDFLDNLGDQKVVLCAQFKEEIYTLLNRYKDWNPRALFGDVAKGLRDDAIRSFQTSEDIRMIVLQPQAAAHGITLTAACHLVFVSLDYNFDNYYQVAKRIERLGQRNAVVITHLIARFQDGSATIDDNLMTVLAKKNKGRDELFGGVASEDSAEATVASGGLEAVADELMEKMMEQRRIRNAARR